MAAEDADVDRGPSTTDETRIDTLTQLAGELDRVREETASVCNAVREELTAEAFSHQFVPASRNSR